MLIRALAILMSLIAVSMALSFYFGAEVLAALGAIIAQLKVVFGRVMALSSKTIFVWLRAQGINFARVELAKRWFFKSVIPLAIGAAAQRRITEIVGYLREGIRVRFDAMMARYRALPLSLRILLILIAMTATVAVTMTSLSLWLILFSVQVPVWILAGLGAVWQMLWQSVQKLVFRTLAFMQLFRLWGVLRDRVPPAYLQRLRRFNFRVARVVVKNRRLTVAQLHNQKHSWGMRWALLREYFRQQRPEGPTKAEYAAMSESKPAGEISRQSRQSPPSDQTPPSPPQLRPDIPANCSTPKPPQRSESAPRRSADSRALQAADSDHPER